MVASTSKPSHPRVSGWLSEVQGGGRQGGGKWVEAVGGGGGSPTLPTEPLQRD